MINVLGSAMESELGSLFVNWQRGAATCMALIGMIHAQPPTPSVTDSSTGDGFVNYNIHQQRSRAIDMRFYCVRDIVRKGPFMVYWIAGEYALEDYFTKHHPISHHQAQRSIYLVPTADASKYTCYMSPNDLRRCFE